MSLIKYEEMSDGRKQRSLFVIIVMKRCFDDNLTSENNTVYLMTNKQINKPFSADYKSNLLNIESLRHIKPFSKSTLL